MKRFCRISVRLLIPIIVCLMASAPLAFPQETSLTQAKKFLLNNQPDKALPLFYQAVSEGQNDPRINLYLGVCYISLGKYADAEQQLSAGKSKDAAGLYLYWYNLGNIYFLQNRFTEAEAAYTAALAARSAYPPAVLNRANTYIKLEHYSQALADYTFYLNLEPASSQREAIQRMVLLLESEQREIEITRMQEEVRKLAEEAERRAAEDRYKKLQEEINANLQSVDDASSLSAGSDETLDYSEDYNIE